jgi:hypothetical protein
LLTPVNVLVGELLICLLASTQKCRWPWWEAGEPPGETIWKLGSTDARTVMLPPLMLVPGAGELMARPGPAPEPAAGALLLPPPP